MSDQTDSPAHGFEIRTPGSPQGTTIKVDGVDVAQHLSGVSLRISGWDRPTLVLEVDAWEGGIAEGLADVAVSIDGSIAPLLASRPSPQDHETGQCLLCDEFPRGPEVGDGHSATCPWLLAKRFLDSG